MQRLPAVAGQFYPDHSGSLRETVTELVASPQEKRSAIGLVVPHAGYLYSGAIAGQTFARVRIPRRVVVMGPNHHGYGHPAAVFASGTWVSPLGTMAVDSELAKSILDGCPVLASDETAHRYEHSLEVLLPFLQVLAPETSIVPICLSRLPLEDLLALGESLGKVLAASGEEVLLVASSDMSHYESGNIAREKDMLALQRVLELDPAGLYQTVAAQKITMCGVMPVTVMLAAARQLGARRGTLVQYGNSGDVTGDQSQVVGYAGLIFDQG